MTRRGRAISASPLFMSSTVPPDCLTQKTVICLHRLLLISSLNVKATICLRQSPPDFLTQHKTTICRRHAPPDPLIQRKNSDWIKVKNFCAMFGKCDSVSLNENALKTITPFPSDRSCQRQLLKDKVLFLARILFISETI